MDIATFSHYSDLELDCNLAVFYEDESDLNDHVVLRGYNPGCTSK